MKNPGSAMKILHLEDDPEDAEIVQHLLAAEIPGWIKNKPSRKVNNHIIFFMSFPPFGTSDFSYLDGMKAETFNHF